MTSPPQHPGGLPAWPRFILSGPAREGARADLDPEELRHAQRVLRLADGATAWGLDGAGQAWPLRAQVGQGKRAELSFWVQGPAHGEAAAGEPGAALPAIELCLAWPRPGREDALLERLTQLGAARLQPLLVQHTGPEDRAKRSERARRVLLQSLKQCQRLWMPELLPARTVQEVPKAAGRELLLDPRAELGLLQSLGQWSPNREPLRLWIGPEGGFSPEEAEAIAARGAGRARLGPHILRIETAAEAALAVAVAVAESQAADKP